MRRAGSADGAGVASDAVFRTFVSSDLGARPLFGATDAAGVGGGSVADLADCTIGRAGTDPFSSLPPLRDAFVVAAAEASAGGVTGRDLSLPLTLSPLSFVSARASGAATIPSSPRDMLMRPTTSSRIVAATRKRSADLRSFIAGFGGMVCRAFMNFLLVNGTG